jgi:hypothetical protein
VCKAYHGQCVKYQQKRKVISWRLVLAWLSLETDAVVETRGKDGEPSGFVRTQAICNQPAEDVAQVTSDFGQDDDSSVIAVTRTPVFELALALDG